LRANGFTTVAASLVKTGDEDKVLAAVKESFTGDGLTWVSERHAPLAEVAEGLGRANKSEQLLEAIRAASAEDVRIAAFWAASEGFIKAGKADDARRAFNEALASANYLKEADDRANELIALAEKARAADRAGEAARALNDARAALIGINGNFRLIIMIKLAALYAKLNDTNQAVLLMNEILSLKESWWTSYPPDNLSAVVEQMAHAGRTPEALGFLVKETPHTELKLIVRRIVVQGLTAAGKIDEALSAMGDTQKPQELLLLIDNASSALIKKGDMTGARRFIEKLFFSPLTPKDWQGHLGMAGSRYFDSIFDNAIKVGDIDRAIQFTQTIEPYAHPSLVTETATPLAQIAIKLIESGQVEKGLQTAGGIRAREIMPFVYQEAAAALIEAGNLDRASEMLRAAQEAVNVPLGFLRGRSLAKVAIAYTKAGKAEEARKVLLTISDEDNRLYTGSRMVWILMRAGKEDEALHLARNSWNEASRSKLLADLTIALAKVGRGEKALSILDSIKYDDDRSRARAAVAKWQARQGMFFAARETAQSCFDTDKLDAYTILLTEYAKKRRPEFAAQFVIKEKSEFEDE
jgi:tetratricopeptide (TPR) repeat protein